MPEGRTKNSGLDRQIRVVVIGDLGGGGTLAAPGRGIVGAVVGRLDRRCDSPGRLTEHMTGGGHGELGRASGVDGNGAVGCVHPKEPGLIHRDLHRQRRGGHRERRERERSRSTLVDVAVGDDAHARQIIIHPYLCRVMTANVIARGTRYPAHNHAPRVIDTVHQRVDREIKCTRRCKRFRHRQGTSVHVNGRLMSLTDIENDRYYVSGIIMDGDLKDDIFTLVHTAPHRSDADLGLVVVEDTYHLGNEVGRVGVLHRTDTGGDHFSWFDDVIFNQGHRGRCRGCPSRNGDRGQSGVIGPSLPGRGRLARCQHNRHHQIGAERCAPVGDLYLKVVAFCHPQRHRQRNHIGLGRVVPVHRDPPRIESCRNSGDVFHLQLPSAASRLAKMPGGRELEASVERAMAIFASSQAAVNQERLATGGRYQSELHSAEVRSIHVDVDIHVLDEADV